MDYVEIGKTTYILIQKLLFLIRILQNLHSTCLGGHIADIQKMGV